MTSPTSTRSASALGPLTTTFTRPSSCTYLFGGASAQTVLDATVAAQAQMCTGVFEEGGAGPNAGNSSFPTAFFFDDVDCWPPAAVETPSSTAPDAESPAVTPLNGRGFYSPGLVCPKGYTTACTQAISDDGSHSAITQGVSFTFQFDLSAGETAVGCCPT